MRINKILLILLAASMFGILAVHPVLCQASEAKASITIADLVGHWGFGSSLMLTYIDHGTGNYSHSGDIYGMTYAVKPDGTFYYKFAARVGTKTIREWGNGTVILTQGFVTFKFDSGAAEKYKFISLKTGQKDGAILSLVQASDASQRLKCGHSRGYFDCTGTQNWELRPAN